MSKRTNHGTRTLMRGYSLALSVFCVTAFLLVGSTMAQDKGFSIFEPPSEDTTSAPVVVSAKEAFTNPNAKLPKSQFGSFTNPQPADSKPQLRGSKAVGTYAHEGPKMFKQAPNDVPAEAGKLKPFVGNSLRSADRPQPDEESSVGNNNGPIVVGSFPPRKTQTAPPVVADDFQKSARRLPPLPKSRPQSTTSTNPKIAQVAFQEGGFRPSGTGRFDTGATTQDRFSQGTNRPQQPPLGQQQRAAQQQPPMRQPLRQQRAPAGQPQGQQQVRSFQSLNSQTSPRSATQPARMAALPPTNPRKFVDSNSGAQPNSTSNATGSKAAKELLNQWVESGDQSQTPGKQMKLHEFLAQPINGSRKNAINQYWETFSDMAKHRLAVQQSNWLASINAPRQQADQTFLKAAQQAAQDRVVVTEIQLTKSQLLLSEFLPNLRDNAGRILPILPADIPWVGKLNTKYEEYQKRGMVPTKFSSIDAILPKARQLISSEANTVVASGQAAEQAKNAMASGQTPIANVLEAARLKSRSEEQFLATVVGYNRAITDYVLSVRQDIYQPKRLASVLIGKKAVVKTTQVNATPEEDNNPMAGLSSNQQMRQVSRTRKTQSQKALPGQSAYQNELGTQQTQQQSLMPQQNQQLTSQPKDDQQASVKKAQTFDYGPTAESAAASNFDPANVKEELPMKQFQPNPKSNYAGGSPKVATRQGGNMGGMSNSTPRSALQSNNANGGFNQQGAGQRSAYERLSSQSRNQPGSTGGGQGAVPSAPAKSTFPAAPGGGVGGGGLQPQQRPSAATGAGGGIGGESPFKQTNSASPSNAGRAGKAFSVGGFGGGSIGGGKTFNSGTSQPPPVIPQTRLGDAGGFGGSSKR